MSLELIFRLFDVVAWNFFLEQPSTNLSPEKFKYASVLNNDFHTSICNKSSLLRCKMKTRLFVYQDKALSVLTVP